MVYIDHGSNQGGPMNRTKVIEAIMKQAEGKSEYLNEALRYLSDTNLLAFALEAGIDTDAVLSEAARS